MFALEFGFRNNFPAFVYNVAECVPANVLNLPELVRSCSYSPIIIPLFFHFSLLIIPLFPLFSHYSNYSPIIPIIPIIPIMTADAAADENFAGGGRRRNGGGAAAPPTFGKRCGFSAGLAICWGKIRTFFQNLVNAG